MKRVKAWLIVVLIFVFVIVTLVVLGVRLIQYQKSLCAPLPSFSPDSGCSFYTTDNGKKEKYPYPSISEPSWDWAKKMGIKITCEGSCPEGKSCKITEKDLGGGGFGITHYCGCG